MTIYLPHPFRHDGSRERIQRQPFPRRRRRAARVLCFVSLSRPRHHRRTKRQQRRAHLLRVVRVIRIPYPQHIRKVRRPREVRLRRHASSFIRRQSEFSRTAASRVEKNRAVFATGRSSRRTLSVKSARSLDFKHSCRTRASAAKRETRALASSVVRFVRSASTG